ncbi:MAG TPA: hydrolase TatD [Porphyromonadaceae bacterium]|nr:hydrolase TatD [Porphyromonadaceae bacterium]
MLIDSHCHIFLEEFDEDREEIVRNALEVGIEQMLLPNIDSSSLNPLLKTIEQYPEICTPMLGLHPTSVKGDYVAELSRIESVFSQCTPCAVGEIGIDLHWNRTYFPEQKDAFLAQLQWSVELNLPVSIHIRDAFKETIDIIEQFPLKEELRGVFHCFSGDKEDLEWVKRNPNFYIGVNGNITYKHAPLNREMLQGFPASRIIVETDCPYLAPIPYRGKRNQPAYLLYTANFLANLLGIEKKEDAYALFTENTKRLFRIEEH